MGFATSQPHETVENMLRRADADMYQKKKDYYEYFLQTTEE